ncbi:PP2C family protein-serine/threonine phosphatase [Aliikangiella maris]|uniref:Protein phosphatase 2C domain-containing protein n=2 Tax=Aliikangiella maris TaxID=3162458 RepID=A0ABV3MU84_9GAMM
MSFQVETISEQGNFRDNNEDAIAWGVGPQQQFCWMVIADGMGGHQAGEVASEMLLAIFRQAMQQIEVHQLKQLNWAEKLPLLMQSANQQIFQSAQSNKALAGMGTTGVVLVLTSQMYHLAWVGDSRAYQIVDGHLIQKTKDHTAIQYLLDKGVISQADASRSNTRHLLAKAIGTQLNVETDYLSGVRASDDQWFLSTDGLHDFIVDQQLTEQLNLYLEQKNTLKTLIELAIANGSTDNITLGIVKNI